MQDFKKEADSWPCFEKVTVLTCHSLVGFDGSLILKEVSSLISFSSDKAKGKAPDAQLKDKRGWERPSPDAPSMPRVKESGS